jgi:hypothetical protein
LEESLSVVSTKLEKKQNLLKVKEEIEQELRQEQKELKAEL